MFLSGEAKGPYTKLQLWEVQEITARTNVRRGEAEWLRASEIPELAAYLTQK
ncbi:GYF domain-containing protein [Microcoleus sp. OTE_8_concoct_300]|uniref:GYF domain-containing protein n=1 Tax=Microcoleus sp. OTE_8_concoct_300 TaxID=2964710 RepID=UPI00403EFEE2